MNFFGFHTYPLDPYMLLYARARTRRLRFPRQLSLDSILFY
uniref:Uncharacterized protein n=1 Tax=Rhizophora mucronata TaxID=61149 RepID=A0A2P2JUV9_RHIMU